MQNKSNIHLVEFEESLILIFTKTVRSFSSSSVRYCLLGQKILHTTSIRPLERRHRQKQKQENIIAFTEAIVARPVVDLGSTLSARFILAVHEQPP